MCGPGAISGVEKMYRLWKGRASLFMAVFGWRKYFFFLPFVYRGAKARKAGESALHMGRIPFFKGVQNLFSDFGYAVCRKENCYQGKAIENIVDLPAWKRVKKQTAPKR